MKKQIIWTEEQNREKITIVNNDIKELSKELQGLHNQIIAFNERKQILRNKISSKHKYKNLLIEQLKGEYVNK